MCNETLSNPRTAQTLSHCTDLWAQELSKRVLVTNLAAIRNLQLYQQRIVGKDHKPVQMHESIRSDSRVRTMMQLFGEGSTGPTQECAI